MGKLEWNGDQVQAQIRAEMGRRVETCCILVASRAKQLLSVSGTGGGGRDGKGRFKRRYGSNPSAPGDPPHEQLGHLRRSVTYEAEGATGRVGTNLLYGRFLELGTRLMQARPWLRLALRECQDQIKAILTAPMKGP